jgi:pilus assembly protein Flp/PilA
MRWIKAREAGPNGVAAPTRLRRRPGEVIAKIITKDIWNFIFIYFDFYMTYLRHYFKFNQKLRPAPQDGPISHALWIHSSAPWSKTHDRHLFRFIEDEDGATAIEYGLIAALVSVAAIGALTAMGENLTTMFESVSSALSSAQNG